MFYTNEELDNLIKEDMPYFDLTTHLLDIEERGVISFYTRNETVSTLNDLISKLAEKLNLEILYLAKAGTLLKEGEKLFEARGNNILILWKVAQNIYEYGCGVAYYTYKMGEIAKKYNPKMEILTTRKVIPFTKKIALQAVLDGGGMPHRITTSETILVFDNYINLYGSWDKFFNNFENLKLKTVEKKWIVEAKNLEMVKKCTQVKVDVIQLDKFTPKETKKAVEIAHKNNVLVLASGGVNIDNIKQYAKTGVDSVVTTSPYFAKGADIKVVIQKG